MANITVSVTDANNITVQLTPVAAQTITIDRGVAGNGISSIVPVTISTLQYLRIYYTNGTQQDVGPLTSTAYAGTSPIDITGNTISLTTVPINLGGTNATTAAAAIQNLLPSYTGNGSKRLGLNSGATALEWVADGGGTVTSVDFSGGTTGLTATGGPITSSGTITLAGTLAVANGGTGVTTSTGTGSVVLSNSPSLVTPILGTPTSGNFSTGTFTWPTFNQNTTGTAAGLSSTLVIASGGTNGTATPTAGAVPYGTGTAYAFTAAGIAGQILQSNGASAPTWANLSSLGVSSFSAGTTGFTPSTATTGAVTLAGTLNAVNGGTGQSSYAVGDLLYASSTTALSKLADVATGNALISGGVSTAPSWGKIGLTTHVSGTLPTANGGTNLTSFTANGVLYASSTSALATGSALTFDGTNFATTGLIRSSSTNGNIGSTGTTGSATVALQTNARLWSMQTSNSDSALYFRDESAGSERMRIASDGAVGIGYSTLTSVGNNGLAVLGNVGIGTSSPGAKLVSEVSGSTAQLKLTQTSYASYNFKVNTDSSLTIDKDGTTRLTVDTSGNLGLGVTPSAWSAGKAIQVNDIAVSLWGISGNTVLGNNSYYNSTDKYATTSGASQYLQNNGKHIWYNAPSGTANTNITFTQAMTLDASGRLVVGDTSTSTSHLLKAANTTTNGLIFTGTNSVLNDGTLSVTVSNASILMVSDNTVGTGAVFFCGYSSATITLIADPSSAFATSITAGRICVTKSANSSTVTITNKSGSTKGITFSKVSTSD